jgi:hypothetical protein
MKENIYDDFPSECLNEDGTPNLGLYSITNYPIMEKAATSTGLTNKADQEAVFSKVFERLDRNQTFEYTTIGALNGYIKRAVYNASYDFFRRRGYVDSLTGKCEEVFTQLGDVCLEGDQVEYAALKLPIIISALRFGNMDPTPYLEDPTNDKRRARFLVQIRTLIKKIKTIPDFRYDLLDHLSQEFPELHIEHLFENPYLDPAF